MSVAPSFFNNSTMKRILLLFALLLTTAGIAFAQSVTVNKIWLEHGATQNNQKGINVHLNMLVHGCKQVALRANAYLDQPKGVGVKDLNGRYCTSAGTVAFWADFTPGYDHTSYEDFSIFMPYDEMHLKQTNKTYYCRVFIFKKGGGAIGNSDYAEFNVTHLSPSATPLNNSARNSHLAPAAGSFPNQQTIYVTNEGGRGGVLSLYCYYADGVKMIRCNLGSGSGLFRFVDDAPDRILFREGNFQPVIGQFNGMAWRDFPNGHTIVLFKDWSKIRYQIGGNYTEYHQFTTKEKFNENQQVLQRMNGGSGSSSAPAQIESGMSESYYRDMYNQYARVAESAYNSLTSTGISATFSDGSKAGSAAGSWQGSNYTQMKGELRKAQNDMARIRAEASRAGYHISQSHWETVSVSY